MGKRIALSLICSILHRRILFIAIYTSKLDRVSTRFFLRRNFCIFADLANVIGVVTFYLIKEVTMNKFIHCINGSEN